MTSSPQWKRLGISLAAALSLTYVGGCGQSLTLAPVGTRSAQSTLRQPSTPPLAYLTGVGGNYQYDIFGYSVASPHVVTCTIQPQNSSINAIGVDKNGVLWLPTQNVPSGQSSIFSYGPDCGAPGITLIGPNQGAPVAIAFGSTGTNYVLMGNLNVVSAFAPGHTSPTSTLAISEKGITGVAGIGVDSHGNVFVACGKGSTHGTVVEFKGGQEPGKDLQLAIGRPGGSITFDSKNDLIVPENAKKRIDIFSPPYTGSPALIPLRGAPWQCSLNKNESLIGCAESGKYFRFYTYPAGKLKFAVGFPNAGASGIAFDPSAPN